jgi:polysaccharide export outer membrane protein
MQQSLMSHAFMKQALLTRFLFLVLLVAAITGLQGCASSGNSSSNNQSSRSNVESTSPDAVSEESPETGTSSKLDFDDEDSETLLATLKKEREVKALNQKIAMQSFTSGVENSETGLDRLGYAIGAGDVLEIAVFQVEELNRKVRVTGDGYIMIPLLGGVFVEGFTTTEIEVLLARNLGENYLQNPQVSVFVDEFRSHQVAVLGAVEEPNIYSIRQPRSVLEMLARAGGLTAKAGIRVQVRRTIVDSETGGKAKETLIMDLNALLLSNDSRLNVLLSGGDSVVVPDAGSIFVEGAVAKPGAYEMRGETTVLKALSMAGGIEFDTIKERIEVYRESITGEDQVFKIDYNEIRSNPASDIVLEEGDIIVVPHSSFKRGLSNFWKGIAGIFSYQI